MVQTQKTIPNCVNNQLGIANIIEKKVIFLDLVFQSKLDNLEDCASEDR